MYNNDYMYAIERSDEYLAHYGVIGMKWGVRKAIASGNSARLSRHYAKAQKKLAKLQKRAANSKKYASRAALLGAGAAVAGGAAYRGTKLVGDVLGGAHRATRSIGGAMVKGANAVQNAAARRRLGNKTAGITGAISRAGHNLERITGKDGSMTNVLGKAASRANKWGKSTSIASRLSNGGADSINNAVKIGGRRVQNAIPGHIAKWTGGKGIVNSTDKFNVRNVSNNTIARAAAGAVGAGLAVGAARNAYKAATAKRKAEKFRSAMNEAFKGTQYANGGKPRQGKKRRK